MSCSYLNAKHNERKRAVCEAKKWHLDGHLIEAPFAKLKYHIAAGHNDAVEKRAD